MKEGEKKDIVWIPLDKIVPSRWRSGIRNKEKYEKLKESIKEHGLIDPIKVFQLMVVNMNHSQATIDMKH